MRPASSGERGVAVARRIGPASKPVTVDVDLPHRLVIDELADDRSLLLVAAYVPSRDASVAKIERKRTFLDQMARALRRFADGPGVVFMGDLNVIGRSHVPRYPAFKAWEYDALEEIAAAGFAAAAHAGPAPAPFPAMPAAPTALAGDFRAALLTIRVGELDTSGFETPASNPSLQPEVVAAAVRADKERLSRPPLEPDAAATPAASGPVDRRVALAFVDFGAADANA